MLARWRIRPNMALSIIHLPLFGSEYETNTNNWRSNDKIPRLQDHLNLSRYFCFSNPIDASIFLPLRKQLSLLPMGFCRLTRSASSAKLENPTGGISSRIAKPFLRGISSDRGNFTCPVVKPPEKEELEPPRDEFAVYSGMFRFKKIQLIFG